MASSAYVETLRTDRTAQVKFMLTAALSLTGFIVFCIEATKSNTSSNSHKYYVTGQNMKERLLPAATVCPTTTDTMVSYATRYWRQLAQLLLTTCKMRTHTKQSTPSSGGAGGFYAAAEGAYVQPKEPAAPSIPPAQPSGGGGYGSI